MQSRKPSLEELLEDVKRFGPKVVQELGIRLEVDEAQHISTLLLLDDIGVEPYDFPSTNGIWSAADYEGVPYKRLATKQFLKTLAARLNVDCRTVEGFREVLQHITFDEFSRVPINRWDTTLQGMLARGYEGSPPLAVLDVISNDVEFEKIKAAGLQPYDFPSAPRGIWRDGNGKPTDVARKLTKDLIKTLAKQKSVDYRTVDGFKRLLPEISWYNFTNTSINVWGTTLSGMLSHAYNGSNVAAVLDVIDKDSEFTKIREKEIKPYDFPKAPQRIWVDKKGNPTEHSRAVVREFIKKVAGKKGVNYGTFGGFKELLEYFTSDNFYSLEVNDWGAKAGSALVQAYNSSPSIAILDVLKHYDEFKKWRTRITPDMLKGMRSKRKDRLEGKYTAKFLQDILDENGLDFSEIGLLSFVNGEKASIRTLLAQGIENHFGREYKLAYFGLEGPAFISYMTFASHLTVDVKNSLFPERSQRTCNIMRRLARMKRFNNLISSDGNTLYGAEIVKSSAEAALKKTKKNFDFVYLDWLGHLTRQKKNELDLAYLHLKARGIIAATLNKREVSEYRFKRDIDPNSTQDHYMERWSEGKGLLMERIDYDGGVKLRTPMTLYIMRYKI
jgi:hypothetical protein